MKHIFINSIPRQGWGKCSSFENFFSHNRKQNVSIFMKHICSVSKQNIFLREFIMVFYFPAISDFYAINYYRGAINKNKTQHFYLNVSQLMKPRKPIDGIQYSDATVAFFWPHPPFPMFLWCFFMGTQMF